MINHDLAVVADRVVGGAERLDGVLLRGSIVNHGVLNDVRILGGGTVDGGTLSGTIISSGTIRDVVLEEGSRIEGGTIGGAVSGRPGAGGGDAPVIDGAVESGAELSHVTIGARARLADGVRLGRGVRFAANEIVPEGLDLTALLSSIGGGAPYRESVADLSADVVVRGATGADPILHSLNALPGVADAGRLLTQDGRSGHLLLEAEGVRFVVRPTAVVQASAGTPVGLSVDAQGQYHAVTADGRRVTMGPALAAPAAFSAAVEEWPAPPEVVEGGVLTAVIDETRRLVVRPALMLSPANRGLPEGVHVVDHPEAPGVPALIHVFADDADRLWEQPLYPVAVSPRLREAIAALPAIAEVTIGEDGVVWARMVTGEGMRGLLDLEVSVGTAGEGGGVTFVPAGDLDGDGVDDFTIVAENGEQQRFHILP